MEILELDSDSNVVWEYRNPLVHHDYERLPNGNTLLTGSTRIVEMTNSGEVVWELVLKDQTYVGPDAPKFGFYKSERIGYSS